MIKAICVCDRCQKPTEKPIALFMRFLDASTNDLSLWQRLPDRVELCEECAEEVCNIATSQLEAAAASQPDPEATAASQPDPEDDQKKQRRRVDTGKVVALRKAGWKVKDIAEEMHLESRQVSNILYQARKRLGKEESDGEEQGNDADE